MKIAHQTRILALGALAFATFAIAPSYAQDTWTVRAETVKDQKAVYATVESIDVIAARARISGTVVSLSVDEGDRVEVGDVMAVVIDDRLAPQVRAIDAHRASLDAERRQARSELERVVQLFDRGVVARARLDEAQTRVDVVQGQLDVAQQERNVLVQQQREGEVLAPTSGVLLNVGVTVGAVVFAGDPVASVATENYVLRLRVPERHARRLIEGMAVRIDQSVIGDAVAETGTIVQVYPQISNGRVIADVEVTGLGEFFVGERVRVWVPAGEREAILLPRHLVHSRFGIDYVTLSDADGRSFDVIVQRGRTHEGTRVEILSGLGEGDVVVTP